MTSTKTVITEYDIEYTWDHAQYWPGAGLAFTDFANIATGTGATPREAFEDACDQIASGSASMYAVDTTALEFPYPEALDLPTECECADMPDTGNWCEHSYFVTVRFNTDRDDD